VRFALASAARGSAPTTARRTVSGAPSTRESCSACTSIVTVAPSTEPAGNTTACSAKGAKSRPLVALPSEVGDLDRDVVGERNPEVDSTITTPVAFGLR
jgi:hypothetical protein